MSEQVTKRPRAPYVSENPSLDWSKFKDSVRKIVQSPKPTEPAVPKQRGESTNGAGQNNVP